MNIQFALLAKYEKPTVALSDISEEYLGITAKTAEQRAKACTLPFPTFKLRDSERSPTLVKIEDLARYIDERYVSGKAEWEAVNE